MERERDNGYAARHAIAIDASVLCLSVVRVASRTVVRACRPPQIKLRTRWPNARAHRRSRRGRAAFWLLCEMLQLLLLLLQRRRRRRRRRLVCVASEVFACGSRSHTHDEARTRAAGTHFHERTHSHEHTHIHMNVHTDKARK